MKILQKFLPHPIETADIELPIALLPLTEILARNTHEVWARQRLDEGWCYGHERNDARKEHPCLVPYENLTENEKNYDRNTAIETLKVILKMGFIIEYKKENECY